MDIKLDTSSGDIDISTGDLVLVEGDDAIIQHLRIRLRFLLGEWFLDTRLGIPYFQKLLGHKVNRTLIQSIFRKVILGTPGVKAMSAIQFEYISEAEIDGKKVARLLRIGFRTSLAGSELPIQFQEEVIA